MGGCENYGPFLGTLNNRCRIIIGTQKGTIILTTTHMILIALAFALAQKKALRNLSAKSMLSLSIATQGRLIKASSKTRGSNGRVL